MEIACNCPPEAEAAGPRAWIAGGGKKVQEAGGEGNGRGREGSEGLAGALSDARQQAGEEGRPGLPESPPARFRQRGMAWRAERWGATCRREHPAGMGSGQVGVIGGMVQRVTSGARRDWI